MMRDTALYYPLRSLVGVRSESIWPSLKKLAAAVLNEDMHAAGIAHDPVRLVFFFDGLSRTATGQVFMSGGTSS